MQALLTEMCNQMINPIRQILIEPKIDGDFTPNRVLEADHETIVWLNKLIVVTFLTLDEIYV